VILHYQHLATCAQHTSYVTRVMALLMTTKRNEQTTVYGPLIQDNQSVLSQRRDLLEQPLDFYERDVFPRHSNLQCQSTTRKPSGLVVFCLQTWYQHRRSNQQCQSIEGSNDDREGVWDECPEMLCILGQNAALPFLPLVECLNGRC